MAREVKVAIIGDASNLRNAFREAEGHADGFGSKMASVGRAASVAFAAVGVAAAGAAIKGVADFAAFDQSMREVFTLMPGVSADAMGEMTDQVKDFSREFGVLPNDVVPALYQALSAGVPAGNVFDFLETAQMAAKGGVTDLTTAVDGISSVVNAFGEESVNAAEASDLMFTAVRLGKTNFEELASSLFNVNPTAAALGVEFGNVTAALATMTAQGVPTSVATTQLRQLLVELGDSGREAGKAFEDTAGQSFADFIAGGGDLAGALDIMKAAADEAGVGVQQMFGSVEAGAAALALDNQGFLDALAEMDQAAGATETAFETMDTGLAATWDRMKANAAVAFLEIGEALAPFALAVSEALLDVGENLRTWFTGLQKTFQKEGFTGVIKLLAEQIRNAWNDEIWPAMQELGKAIGDWFEALWDDHIKPAINTTWDAMVAWIKNDGATQLGQATLELVDDLVDWISAEGIPAAERKLQELIDGMNRWVQSKSGEEIFKIGAKIGGAIIAGMAIMQLQATIWAMQLVVSLGKAIVGLAVAWWKLGWEIGRKIGEAIVHGVADAIKRLPSIIAGALTGGRVSIGLPNPGSILDGLLGRAMGGPVMAGTTYMVGERGPELFRPNTSGSIIPNHALGSAASGSAPVYNVTINNPVGEPSEATLQRELRRASYLMGV